MPELDILDLGGGFSMNAKNPVNNFDQVAPKIRQLLKKEILPLSKKCRFIAEPGRQMCQDTLTVAMKIVLTRDNANGTRDYFVDSGVYQALGCQVFDKEFFKGHPVVSQKEYSKRMTNEKVSTIWGQTCDGVDWLTKGKALPLMYVDEWIMYRHVGAYNKETACEFNSFGLPKTFYLTETNGKILN